MNNPFNATIPENAMVDEMTQKVRNATSQTEEWLEDRSFNVTEWRLKYQDLTKVQTATANTCVLSVCVSVLMSMSVVRGV